MAPLCISAFVALLLLVSGATPDGICSVTGECESKTHSTVLLQTVSHGTKVASNETDDLQAFSSPCDEGTWPDRDHGLVCGACKVLVNRFSTFYQTCDGYCSHRGRQCVGAWEERDDTCDVLHSMTCDQQLDSSDAICECSADGVASPPQETGEAVSPCDEESWPDKDHGLVCGTCKVLVNRFSSEYKSCNGYCRRRGRQCVGAWEERDDTCDVLHTMTCDQQIDSSDAICECGAEVDPPESGPCYGQLSQVAKHEGNGVGQEVHPASVVECERLCTANSDCRSFAYCPSWNACWMKDASFTGGEATKQVGDCRTFFKTQDCSAAIVPAPPVTSGCAGSSCRSIKVMSYNTEYRNYNARMHGYAKKIREVAPAIVGLQECQNRDGLADLSGYTANTETGRQNYMLFDPSEVTLLGGGAMSIPRDNYAPRAITWGQFKLGGVTIWFFNTHLPHNHNQAASRTTHARIAGMFLQKRKDLGAEHAPTIVVGDMNSHASNFNRVHTGGFESNLEANGFVWAYTARGNPGYGRIDHILYSAAHWTHSDCRDTGTGGSDHTSITCDLKLK